MQIKAREMDSKHVSDGDSAAPQSEKEIDLPPLEDFLVGPGRTSDSLVIDEIFGKDFDEICKDALHDNPDAFSPLGKPIPATSKAAAGYFLQEVEGGMALYSPAGELAGGYIGCDIAIKPEHRRKGLGPELVRTYYLANDSLPTWDLDDASYTPAGLRCHEAAWQLLHDEMQARATSEEVRKQNPCRP
jgi:GNAT superfamily N-acetyltransferase